MEIKINKEILTYQETIFFGLTMRQFFCSALGGCNCPGAVCAAQQGHGPGIGELDLYSGGRSLCGGWLFSSITA